MPNPSFDHLCILSLESRRATEMATLISTFGGRPLTAPAMREVPLESNRDAIAFAEALTRGEYDAVVLLTGVGLRALLSVVESVGMRDAFVTALKAVKIIARGPKPLAVLRELAVAPWIIVPEPNTWRELLGALDARGDDAVRSLRVAVQEYGTSPESLVTGLRERGARITRVPVYRYALPEDLEPLRRAVTAVANGTVDIVLFTTATQVAHLLHVAETMGKADDVRQQLRNLVVASIGPTTSEELREQQVEIDLEASHPKMGVLVRDAAERGPTLLRAKRATA